MSKQAGFMVPPADPTILPSAPPSYEEAMRAIPAGVPVGVPVTHQPQQSVAQPMPMPMPMPQPVPMQQPLYSGVPSAHAVGPTAQPHFQQTTVITVPATTVVSSTPGRERCYMHCPHCNSSVLTETLEEHSALAHICCCVLFWVGCGLCSCLPYCMDSFKSVSHKCPNCGGHLGTYKAC